MGGIKESRVSVFAHENRVETAVYPHDVFALTELGTEQIQSGGTSLPAEALEVLVSLDGKRTIGDVEHALPHLQPDVLRNLVRSLLAARLVREVTMAELGELELDIGAFLKGPAAHADEPSIGTVASADREALSGAPALVQNGYYVSIARQALKPRASLQGLAAFIVEDDPDVAALVQRLLQGLGLKAGIAPTKDAAMARMRQAPLPDLVILDVHLPDLNGFDLLKAMKRHPALKAVPVVMLTAEANRASVVQGLATGADGYITKPFAHDALLRGVKAVLGFDGQ